MKKSGGKRKISSIVDNDIKNDNINTSRRSSRETVLASKGIYAEPDSDDEFARKNFMFSKEEISKKNMKSKKNQKSKKIKEKIKFDNDTVIDNANNNSRRSTRPQISSRKYITKYSDDDEFECSDLEIIDDNNDNTDKKDNDNKNNKNISLKDYKSDDDINSSNDSDDSDNDVSNDDTVVYRIEHILGYKCVTSKNWQAICLPMETREITRGSVLKQPDSEFFDESTIPIEKFLIKWLHASYLHVSWETEKDLLDLCGTAAKTALKKFFLRKVSLFEDLREDEYFPASFTEIERVIDIEDNSVNVAKIDYLNAILPDHSTISTKENNSDNNDIDMENEDTLSARNKLHGDVCFLTIKWEGLQYGEVTVESVEDLRYINCEYEQSLRNYYKREQSMPCKNEKKIIRRKLDIQLMDNEIPVFPDGRELRDYQWEGVRWMLFNWSQKRNSILADEMGLGKTIQTAVFLQMLKTKQQLRGPYLIVVPLSTLANWQREIIAWTDMDVVVYYGNADDRKLIRDFEFFYSNKNKIDGYKFEIVLTTPETCIISENLTTKGNKELTKITWDMIVIDEAHKLKNYDSKLSIALREDFDYRNSLLLTGTPLQNNTDELWSLLNFVARVEFEDRSAFIKEFGDLKTSEQLDALHSKLKPYILRRDKDTVEKTVPPKEEIIIQVELTIPQKQYYRAIYEQKTGFLYQGGAKDGPSLSNLAMELRKCCNHPFLIKGAETILRQHFNNETNDEIMVKSSGKMTLLDKLLPKLQSDGHRVLIFSQFRIMLDIIEDYLSAKRYSFERVDGAITGRKRQAAIDRFSLIENNVFVMLLSTRAGGVGINLTSADTVIIFDSDWNPQNDLQAMARAHRIGQTRDVKIYRFLTRGTYETAMFKAASLKLGLDYALMHNIRGNSLEGISGERTENISSLSKKELENLLKHGAYDMFKKDDSGEADAESTKFCEADIDQILQRSSIVIHGGNKQDQEQNKKASFSKASFVSSGSNNSENDVAIDDPQFWSKIVGLSAGNDVEETTNKRRMARGSVNYKEPGLAQFKLDNKEDSDSEEENDEDKIEIAEFNQVNIMKILTSMNSRGYGNWEAINKDSKLKWSLRDISRGCRYALLNLLFISCLSTTTSTIKENNEILINQSDNTTLVIDLIYLESHLVNNKACRLALASFNKDVFRISNSDQINNADDNSRNTKIIENDILLSAFQNNFTPDLLSPTCFFETFNKNIVENKEDIDMNSDDNKEYKDNMLNSSYYIIDMNEIESITTTEELQDSNIKKTHQYADIVTSLKHVASEISTEFKEWDIDKIRVTKSLMRAKLLQIEDMFEFYLTQIGCVEGGVQWKEVCVEDTKIDSKIDSNADAMCIDATNINAFNTTIGTANATTNATIIDSFVSFDVESSPILAIMESLLSTSKRSEEDDKALARLNWTIKLDLLVIRAIVNYGWLEGKRKLSSFIELIEKNGFNQEFVQELKEGKFIIKRSKELATLLRGEIIKKQKKEKIVLVKPVKEIDYTKKLKQQVNAVIRTIQRLGRPRSMYDELISQLNSSSSSSIMENNNNDNNYIIENSTDVDTTGDSTDNKSDLVPLNISAKLSYLLTWEMFQIECNCSIELIKLKEIVTAISDEMNDATRDEDPNRLLTKAPLDGITYKTIESCWEKSEIMHRLRLGLINIEENKLIEAIKRNCKHNGVSVHPAKRDVTLPVWWTINHDIQLLASTAINGIGMWKKIILDPLLSTPMDFEMPARLQGIEWTVVLSIKVAEKRFNSLISIITPLILYKSLPVGSPDFVSKKLSSLKSNNSSKASNLFATSSGAATTRPSWATSLIKPKPIVAIPIASTVVSDVVAVDSATPIVDVIVSVTDITPVVIANISPVESDTVSVIDAIDNITDVMNSSVDVVSISSISTNTKPTVVKSASSSSSKISTATKSTNKNALSKSAVKGKKTLPVISAHLPSIKPSWATSLMKQPVNANTVSDGNDSIVNNDVSEIIKTDAGSKSLAIVNEDFVLGTEDLAIEMPMISQSSNNNNNNNNSQFSDIDKNSLKRKEIDDNSNNNSNNNGDVHTNPKTPYPLNKVNKVSCSTPTDVIGYGNTVNGSISAPHSSTSLSTINDSAKEIVVGSAKKDSAKTNKSNKAIANTTNKTPVNKGL